MISTLIPLGKCTTWGELQVESIDSHFGNFESAICVKSVSMPLKFLQAGLCLSYPYMVDPRPLIPPRVVTSSAMGLELGVFGFLPTTYVKTNATQMRPRSLRAVRRFTRVYLHAQTAVDAGDIRTWQTMVILISGKTWRPPNWAPCRNQDGAGSGISCVYLWSSLSWRNTSTLVHVMLDSLHQGNVKLEYLCEAHIFCGSSDEFFL